eukprot:Rhum_TRINITY_DN11659_c0_g1::Rhum_TRINITY_DN11659_c0_g1_i1::g.46025::m.46025
MRRGLGNTAGVAAAAAAATPSISVHAQQARRATSASASSSHHALPTKYWGYDQFKNKHKYPWYEILGQRTKNLDDDKRAGALRGRLRGREYLPVFPQSYHRHVDDRSVPFEYDDDSTGVGRLPFIRNAIASVHEVVDVLGSPDVFTGNEERSLSHHSVGISAPLRPHDQRPRSVGPAASASQFMGAFLNSFVALDVDQWDIDALMADPERPEPYFLLRHLTDLLENRHMRPRKLKDAELAGILAGAATGEEVRRCFAYALEHHAPGMRCVGVLGSRVAGDPLYVADSFDEVLRRGVPASVEGVNGVLRSFRPRRAAAAAVGGGEDAAAPARLLLGEGEEKRLMDFYGSLVDGRLDGVDGDVESYNAVLRALVRGGGDGGEEGGSESSAERAVAVYAEMAGARVQPNSFTLNVLLENATRRGVGGFDGAAAVFDALCVPAAQRPRQVGVGGDADADADATASAQQPLHPATPVVPTRDTWALLLEALGTFVPSESLAEGGEAAAAEAYAARLFFVLDRSASLQTRWVPAAKKGAAVRRRKGERADFLAFCLPTPFVYDGLLAAVGRAHVRLAELAATPVAETPQYVEAYFAALRDVAEDEEASPVLVRCCSLLADAMWVSAEERRLLNTPKGFLHPLAFYAAAGETAQLEAVYESVLATPFLRPEHHSVVKEYRARHSLEGEEAAGEDGAHEGEAR